ncbi:MAG: hypothetical protein R3C61_05730 [Bacteroidia bacterium]
MRKILVFLSVISGLGIMKTQAQITDRLVPHMGFMWEFVTYEQPPDTFNQILSTFYNFHIGTYYTIAHYNDIFSFGIDPSVQLGLNFVPVSPNGFDVYTRVNYVIQAPVYLMGKVGATATRYNQQKVGIAAGFGVNYNYISQQDGNINLRRNISYFVPGGVVEATILSRGNPLTARFHYTFAKVNTDIRYKDINSKEIVQTLNFPLGSFGIGLIYGF